MKLDLKSRIILLNMLPGKGSFEELVLIKDVSSKIEVKPIEIEKYNIKTVEGRLFWDDPKKEWEYDFSESEKNLIQKTLKELSDRKELTTEHVSLYETFVSK